MSKSIATIERDAAIERDATDDIVTADGAAAHDTTAHDTAPGVRIDHVSRVFTAPDGSRVQALDNVDLTVEPGEFVSIIGPSGCGKTTLLRLIAGLDDSEEGRVLVDGAPVQGPDPSRGYVFQQGSLFPWLTVRENIAFGLKAQHTHRQRRDDIETYIGMVGLRGFENAYPHQISGGMAQRVAIARALIARPRVLLLDEPMGALDSFTRADLQDRLLDIWRTYRMTMVLVTHDVDEAIYLGTKVVVMSPRPGRIKEIIPIELADRDRVSDDFTAYRRRLLTTLHFDASHFDAHESES